MSAFESGVQDYVHATATVDVFFPIDKNGNAYVRCDQCYYFKEQSKRCALNGEVCAFPTKYVGDSCPLTPVVDEATGEIIKSNLKENYRK